MSDRQHRIEAESRGALSGGNVLNLTLTAATSPYQLKPTDQIVRAITAEADAVAIITMPSKAEAIGKFYYICAPTGATGGDISVYDKEAGSEIATYGDMDADDDWAIFFTDGVLWRNIAITGVA